MNFEMNNLFKKIYNKSIPPISNLIDLNDFKIKSFKRSIDKLTINDVIKNKNNLINNDDKELDNININDKEINKNDNINENDKEINKNDNINENDKEINKNDNINENEFDKNNINELNENDKNEIKNIYKHEDELLNYYKYIDFNKNNDFWNVLYFISIESYISKKFEFNVVNNLESIILKYYMVKIFINDATYEECVSIKYITNLIGFGNYKDFKEDVQKNYDLINKYVREIGIKPEFIFLRKLLISLTIYHLQEFKDYEFNEYYKMIGKTCYSQFERIKGTDKEFDEDFEKHENIIVNKIINYNTYDEINIIYNVYLNYINYFKEINIYKYNSSSEFSSENNKFIKLKLNELVLSDLLKILYHLYYFKHFKTDELINLNFKNWKSEYSNKNKNNIITIYYNDFINIPEYDMIETIKKDLENRTIEKDIKDETINKNTENETINLKDNEFNDFDINIDLSNYLTSYEMNLSDKIMNENKIIERNNKCSNLKNSYNYVYIDEL